MNGKTILAMALMLVMLSSSAFATLTVTITSPANGSTYNNYPANVRTIPITFTIADDNAVIVGSDMNFNLRYGIITTAIVNKASGTNIMSDANIFDYNIDGSLYSTTIRCDIKDHGPTLATCTYNWPLPNNASLIQGTYWIDVNAVDFYRGGGGLEQNQADTNATIWFTINNRMETMGSVTSLLVPISALLVAALLIIGIFAITVLGADPMKTSVMIVAGAITITVIAMLLGYFVGIM